MSGLDITPNSPYYPTKNSMVLVGRMNLSIVGMKGLRYIQMCRIKLCLIVNLVAMSETKLSLLVVFVLT